MKTGEAAEESAAYRTAWNEEADRNVGADRPGIEATLKMLREARQRIDIEAPDRDL